MKNKKFKKINKEKQTIFNSKFLNKSEFIPTEFQEDLDKKQNRSPNFFEKRDCDKKNIQKK